MLGLVRSQDRTKGKPTTCSIEVLANLPTYASCGTARSNLTLSRLSCSFQSAVKLYPPNLNQESLLARRPLIGLCPDGLAFWSSGDNDLIPQQNPLLTRLGRTNSQENKRENKISWGLGLQIIVTIRDSASDQIYRYKRLFTLKWSIFSAQFALIERLSANLWGKIAHAVARR